MVDIKLHYHTKQLVPFNTPHRFTVLSAGRRFGKTEGAKNWIINECFRNKKKRGLWIDVIYSNIDRYIERYFMPVIGKVCQFDKQKKIIRFPNKSYIDFKSADRPESMEGFGYDTWVLNEAGIILKNERLWYNTIKPMTIEGDSTGKFVGTPKGKNLFHKLALKGQDENEKDWAFFKYTSFDNPYLPPEEIKSLQYEMPELAYKQEILAEFTDTNGSVFQNPHKVFFGKPSAPSPQKTYSHGIDLAKHMDFTVHTVFDPQEKRVVHMERYNKVDWSVQIERIFNVCNDYSGYITIDCTGVGDPIFEALASRQLKVEGFHFTAQSKKALIDKLIIAIERQQISIPSEYKIYLTELENYEYEVTRAGNIRINAQSGYHDDCVISLALAIWKAPLTVMNHKDIWKDESVPRTIAARMTW